MRNGQRSMPNSRQRCFSTVTHMPSCAREGREGRGAAVRARATLRAGASISEGRRARAPPGGPPGAPRGRGGRRGARRGRRRGRLRPAPLRTGGRPRRPPSLSPAFLLSPSLDPPCPPPGGARESTRRRRGGRTRCATSLMGRWKYSASSSFVSALARAAGRPAAAGACRGRRGRESERRREQMGVRRSREPRARPALRSPLGGRGRAGRGRGARASRPAAPTLGVGPPCRPRGLGVRGISVPWPRPAPANLNGVGG